MQTAYFPFLRGGGWGLCAVFGAAVLGASLLPTVLGFGLADARDSGVVSLDVLLGFFGLNALAEFLLACSRAAFSST